MLIKMRYARVLSGEQVLVLNASDTERQNIVIMTIFPFILILICLL